MFKLTIALVAAFAFSGVSAYVLRDDGGDEGAPPLEPYKRGISIGNLPSWEAPAGGVLPNFEGEEEVPLAQTLPEWEIGQIIPNIDESISIGNLPSIVIPDVDTNPCAVPEDHLRPWPVEPEAPVQILPEILPLPIHPEENVQILPEILPLPINPELEFLPEPSNPQILPEILPLPIHPDENAAVHPEIEYVPSNPQILPEILPLPIHPEDNAAIHPEIEYVPSNPQILPEILPLPIHPEDNAAVHPDIEYVPSNPQILPEILPLPIAPEVEDQSENLRPVVPEVQCQDSELEVEFRPEIVNPMIRPESPEMENPYLRPSIV